MEGSTSRPKAATTAGVVSIAPALIDHRFRLLGVIGRGATGTVYRARDRLTGRLVALKTVAGDAPTDDTTSVITQQHARVPDLLAREFQLLAGLRHPNVIATLDYGLDARRLPFFTMDLQDNVSTLREAAAGASFEVKVELVVQLLHALAYLHRRGITHRDVKPENALCAGGVVKLIDFGLAVAAGDTHPDSGGTLAYAAPEVLRGRPATRSADLYATGVILYELLAGQHPFDASSPPKLLQMVFQSTPDFAKPGIDARVVDVLRRLLAREPTDRFDDGLAVIAALATALARPFPIETTSTRESFLHAAQLIGRDAELEQLRNALPDTPDADCRSVLVGGESGVGKSRLLDELEAEAMVRGIRVLRGQAMREGSRPYELWRGALRLLAVLAEPDQREASVLKGAVPDIAVLLGRDVVVAPELDPEATHVRLVRVVEALLRRCPSPLLVLLEDMQWAGTESLKLFARVQSIAPELRLLLVGSFRSDERPNLPTEVPGATSLTLGRLTPNAVARLCTSMIGERNADPEQQHALADLVTRESGGNVFLVLEVMRTLADEAGGLERVGSLATSAHLFSGRIERLVNRRVERLSEQDRAFLRTAAVAGRELDLTLLARLHEGVDVQASASRAVEAAVLSSVQGRVWFAHDKLREALIDELPDDERRRIHRLVANAILASMSRDASTLAHHFGAARETAREKEFAALAGDQFLRSGAYHDAIPYLQRALALSTGSDPPLARAIVERQLGEALFRSGQLVEARASLAAALATLGRPLPRSRPRLVLGLLREAGTQLGLRARRGAPAPRATTEVGAFKEAILAYTQLSRLAHHLNDAELVLHVTLSALNLSERGALHAHHAELASVMGAVMGLLPVNRWARFYFELARSLSARLDDPRIHAFVLAHQGYYEAGVGEWEACRENLERSMALYDQVGDVRLREESISILAYALFFKGELPESRELYRMLERSGEERLDAQIIGWGLTNRIKLLVRAGDLGAVDDLLTRADPLLVDGITKSVRDGVGIELELARDNLPAAVEAANAASARLERSAPRSFMAVSTYATIAAALLEGYAAAKASRRVSDARRLDRLAARAIRALGKVARVFPIARPAQLLHAGTLESLRGRHRRARRLWEEAADQARTRDLPLEEALALRALAACPDTEHREEKRERARTLLDRLGTLSA